MGTLHLTAVKDSEVDNLKSGCYARTMGSLKSSIHEGVGGSSTGILGVPLSLRKLSKQQLQPVLIGLQISCLAGMWTCSQGWEEGFGSVCVTSISYLLIQQPHPN